MNPRNFIRRASGLLVPTPRFLFSPSNCGDDPCCEHETCGCLNQPAPDELTVTLAGIASPAFFGCTGCSSMNGTYVLSWVACEDPSDGGVGKADRYHLDPSCFVVCPPFSYSTFGITLKVFQNAGTRKITVSAGVPSSSGSFLLGPETDDPYDCDSFSSLDIPLAAGAPTTPCDWSAATCTLDT